MPRLFHKEKAYNFSSNSCFCCCVGFPSNGFENDEKVSMHSYIFFCAICYDCASQLYSVSYYVGGGSWVGSSALSKGEEGFVNVDWYSTTKQPVHNLFPKMQPFSCLLAHLLISCWSVCLLPDCLYMQLLLLRPFIFRSQVVLPPAHLFTHPACLFIPFSTGLSLTAHLFVVKPYCSPLCSCATTCLPTSSHLFVDQTYCE